MNPDPQNKDEAFQASTEARRIMREFLERKLKDADCAEAIELIEAYANAQFDRGSFDAEPAPYVQRFTVPSTYVINGDAKGLLRRSKDDEYASVFDVACFEGLYIENGSVEAERAVGEALTDLDRGVEVFDLECLVIDIRKLPGYRFWRLEGACFHPHHYECRKQDPRDPVGYAIGTEAEVKAWREHSDKLLDQGGLRVGPRHSFTEISEGEVPNTHNLIRLKYYQYEPDFDHTYTYQTDDDGTDNEEENEADTDEA